MLTSRFLEVCSDPVIIVRATGELVQRNRHWKELDGAFFHFGEVLYFNKENHMWLVESVHRYGYVDRELELYDEHEQSFRLTITFLEEDLFICMLKADSTSSILAETTHSIIESMVGAFYSLDNEYRFAYMNTKAGKMLEREPQQLIGKVVWEEFPSSRETNVYDHFKFAIENMEPVTFEDYYEPLDTWFDVQVIPNRTGGLSVYFHNINEKKELEVSLWNAAHTDFLTGLPNRRRLYQFMDISIADKEPFVIYYINLIQFRSINDLYGHEVGDLLIKEIGRRLKVEIHSGTVCHLSGDDFAVIYQGIHGEPTLSSFGETLIELFSKPFVIEGLPAIYVDPSIGASIFPIDGKEPDTLLDKAAVAMEEAKKKDASYVMCYDRDMHEAINREIMLAQELRNAILNEELSYHYQPQVDSRTHEIIGMEVLTRWNHPVLGPIPPNTFIPIAEANGVIEGVTRNQITVCLAEFKRLRNNHRYNGTISFNISSRLLTSRSFIDFLVGSIREAEVPFEKIELELTESVQLFSDKDILKHLSILRERGLRFAIDDFGTGYSMLSYLNRFPIDKLKIDKSFIDPLGVDLGVESVLISIIGLARNLHLEVIAEGVETEEQCLRLQEHGCYDVQGYYYYKPLTCNDLSLVLMELHHQ
ncbi:EAL domain-containing protein [Paenalkalicoccus suaedae]|uniref:EAL domain-containing protein n=1 Tax=Paenalkalicoccus suaedae TaxID=2592382 RepID=A0A859FAJ2_9BACI|nr:EAL domain-containing protein [Paenalkalicoccus suaedae]QKS69957.1 EAL domain-containing protein [Paenalkalicoccus suaedae]